MIRHIKNYDYYHKGREGGGQRFMIEIIISENDDNDGRPLLTFIRTHRTLVNRISGSSGLDVYDPAFLGGHVTRVTPAV